MSRKYFLFILIIIFKSYTFAQTEIFGIVTNESDDNLPGVFIAEINTVNSTATDLSGEFKLTVSDTAKVLISLSGKNDTIIDADDLRGKTIVLSDIKLNEKEPFLYSVSRHLSPSLYGDFRNAPFGFGLQYIFYDKRGYIKKISGSCGIAFKTDFKSNRTLRLNLSKFYIIDFRKYSLSAVVAYDHKKVEISENGSVTNDLYFVLSNSFYYNVQLVPGFIYRKESYESEENTPGFYFAGAVSFPKPGNSLYGHFNYYGEYFEYGFSVYQNLSNKHRILKHFRAGIYYDKFRRHNEFGYELIFMFD